MRKLTLISFMCRHCVVTAFVWAKFENEKAIISPQIIDILFWEIWRFIPKRGETIAQL